MTTFGDPVYQMGGVPVGGRFSAGQGYFLRPSTGSDGNLGKRPDDAFKTWTYALSQMTADSGDTLYAISEDNSASGTTDYQSSTLTLNKDGVNFVGINSGGVIGQRSRIAQLSTATGVGPLVTFSGSNCFMSNIHIYHGVDDSTSGTAAISVTGDRNHFYRCHFAGIGHATMDTGNNCSLSLTGDENLFEECVIGLDTIARGTASNSEIYFPAGGQATRNIFRNCIIPTNAEAAGHQFIVSNGAAALDRFTLFENCLFVNSLVSGVTTMTEALDCSANAGGTLIFRNCTLVGCTEWDAGDAGAAVVVVDGPTPTPATTGIAVQPAT